MQTLDGKRRKLIVVGDSAFAEIACVYFESSKTYDVVAFCVERAFCKRTELMDKPIVPFEEVTDRYPPQEHEIYVAIVYTQLNRLRTRLARQSKEKGYKLASYISPYAFIGPNVQIGDHCFIFENNVVQPFVTIGNNVVLWSGNHIGHHSRIYDNVFVSSHVVISGFCEIGVSSFLGVNASVGNNIMIADDCWIGPGVVVSGNTKTGELFRESSEPELAKVSAPRFFRVRE